MISYKSVAVIQTAEISAVNFDLVKNSAITHRIRHSKHRQQTINGIAIDLIKLLKQAYRSLF